MIKDVKKRDKLLSAFPEISDEELTEIAKQYMPQYVVYKQIKQGRHECYCTACGKHYINDRQNRDYVIIMGHKQKGICLSCGKEVTFLARGRSRNNLWDSRNFAIYKRKGKNIYIQTYKIFASFTETGRSDFEFESKCELYKRKFYPYYRYALTPNGAQKWGTYWKYNHMTRDYDLSWGYYKQEGQPNFSTSVYSSDTAYDEIGVECIEKSFLSHVLKAARESTCWYNLADKSIRFFCECCEHPNIEYLLKTGFGYIIEERYVYGTSQGYRINWCSNDVKKMLKLNKVEMELLADHDCDTLHKYMIFKKMEPSMSVTELFECANKVNNIEVFLQIINRTGLSLRKAMNYWDKHKMPIRDWNDYLDQCEKLDYDISDESISRPKDFFAAHERLSRILETMANEEKQRLFDLNNKLREDMQFVDEGLGLMIVLPKSVNDIVREGKLQNHCVGGYAERHAEGKLHILFLRKIDEPDKPYYTMEVNTKGTIVQCRGYANNWAERGGKPKTDDVIEFEKRYQKYLTKLFNKSNRPKQKIKIA